MEKRSNFRFHVDDTCEWRLLLSSLLSGMEVLFAVSGRSMTVIPEDLRDQLCCLCTTRYDLLQIQHTVPTVILYVSIVCFNSDFTWFVSNDYVVLVDRRVRSSFRFGSITIVRAFVKNLGRERLMQLITTSGGHYYFLQMYRLNLVVCHYPTQFYFYQFTNSTYRLFLIFKPWSIYVSRSFLYEIIILILLV